MNARAVGRLGLLAMGLGIAAAVASTPGVAAADSSVDSLSWLAGLDPADLSAASTRGLDIQISIDGMDLFPTAGNTASATSGMGDIAIAIGAGSVADSGAGNAYYGSLAPGLFDVAVATGGGTADAGQGNFDSAFADGTGSTAASGGYDSVLSNGDWAAAIGPNTDAEAGVFSSVPSQNDGALIFDPFGTLGSTAEAGDGNSDLAVIFGDNANAYAGGNALGIGGPTDFPGNYDLAAVFGNSSDAVAGASASAPGDFDLAAAFGDLLNPAATGANFLVDILPSLF